MLTFLERKELARNLLAQNLKMACPDLEDVSILSSSVQNELESTAFKLAQIIGTTQSELLISKNKNEVA